MFFIAFREGQRDGHMRVSSVASLCFCNFDTINNKKSFHDKMMASKELVHVDCGYARACRRCANVRLANNCLRVVCYIAQLSVLQRVDPT